MHLLETFGISDCTGLSRQAHRTSPNFNNFTSVRKVFILLVLSLYSIGHVFLPDLDIAQIRIMYHHCALEDPDINAADFVFEHLLGLKDPFETGGHDDEPDEQPHQPFHEISSFVQHVFVAATPYEHKAQTPQFSEPLVHTIYFNKPLPSGQQSELLRPPAV